MATRPTNSPLVTRTKVVWASLVAAMLTVSAGLFVLNDPSAISSQGLALTPLVRTSGPNTLEPIFNTRTSLDEQRWQGIVIHHSDTAVGSPISIENDHRALGLNGLGYHFLVGNGAGMDEGSIHVSYRWLDQVPGAHVAGPEGDAFNQATIGICLVGDGDRRGYSETQLQAAAQLVATLADRFGLATDRVWLHSDLAETTSPGRLFPRTAFLERVRANRTGS